jgi:adenylate cyclase
MGGSDVVGDDLYFEILKSERVRVRALAILMGSLFTVSLAMVLFGHDWIPGAVLLEQRVPLGTIAAFYGAAFAYELLAHTVLGVVIAKRRRLPEAPRYGNALLETSIPTVMMVLLSGTVGPEIALNTPLPMAYFLFICLSTLRMTASLSIFTGCVAALEYAGLGLYYFGIGSVSDPYVTSIWAVLTKAAVLVIAGLVCGFVGTQIRRRLISSLETVTERNRVVGMFGQYVSPAVVDQLLNQPVEGTGEERYVTIMFLDIRGFTAFAERRTPSEVVAYLNTLFATMIRLVNANNGIINKFLGDGFMACFGAPLSDGHDTQNAVRAALDIAQAVERMSADGTIAPTRIGIGLHAGTAVTGSVGSEERREYTIIGDTVNLASRVEQLTKQYGVPLLVTDAVWQVVKADYEGRALDPVTVRGREEPVAIYAVS